MPNTVWDPLSTPAQPVFCPWMIASKKVSERAIYTILSAL